MMKWSKLQKRIRGTITTGQLSNFLPEMNSLVWNEIKPNRTPNAIVTVKDENDIVETVNFASENGLKIVVRGGGHSWCGLAVRNNCLTINLSELNEFSINQRAQTAVIQPVISNQELAQHLLKHDLAFPIGHCPTVSASGYLLNGGMSWNLSAWGPACLSVEAIEFVTASGERLKASTTEYPDLFWAARGCGPGMFAVATRFHLKCYPHPKVILTSTYFCSLEKLKKIVEEVTTLGWKMPSFVELSIFLMKAPPALTEKCKSTNGKLCMISAVAFAETEKAGTAALALLEESNMAKTCWSKSTFEPSSFHKLMDASGATWPENHRTLAESQCSYVKPVDILMALRKKIIDAPSTKSVFAFCLSTGQHNLLMSNENTSLSMSGQLYGGSWAIWETPEGDAVNLKWQSDVISILKPFTNLHYIGETDIVQNKTHVQESYTKEKWKRLQEIRTKYDPEGLFCNFLDGINPS